MAELVSKLLKASGAELRPEMSPVLSWQPRTDLPAEMGTDMEVASLRRRVGVCAALRDQIAQCICSEERWGTERYRTTGRLDRRAITRTQRDAGNVFTRRTHVPGVDAAVLLLIDGSHSMAEPISPLGYVQGQRIDAAKVLAFHLTEAAEAARGQVGVAGFYGRGNDAQLAWVKRFDSALDMRGLAGLRASSSTPLAAAMMGGGASLQERTATRRILLVLTDGDGDLGNKTTLAACDLLEATGVEVVGIGCAFEVSGAFRRSVNVMDLAELADQGLSALVKILAPAEG